MYYTKNNGTVIKRMSYENGFQELYNYTNVFPFLSFLFFSFLFVWWLTHNIVFRVHFTDTMAKHVTQSSSVKVV